VKDILNGRNLQCFCVPCGIDEQKLTIQYKTTKRKFDFDRPLPYHSLMYDYSEDFIIFDYENVKKNLDQSWIHIIEDGKCQFYIPSDIMDEKYPILLVVNKYGIPLKVKEPAEFLCLQEDYINMIKESTKIKHDDPANAQKRIQALEIKFQNKWYDYKKVSHIFSNVIGVALTILSVNQEYDIKDKLARYCAKHNLDLSEEIIEYVEWANLHNIDVTIDEIKEILI
jgi:hypothetical protein